MVLYYIAVVQRLQDLDLVRRAHLLLRQVDLLHGHELAVAFPFHQVHRPEGALADFFDLFVVLHWES